MVLIKEKESSSESDSKVGDKLISESNQDFDKNPDVKIGFQEKGSDYLKEKMLDFEGSTSSLFRKVGISDYNNCSSNQELSLRYLEKTLDGKIGFQEKGGDFMKEGQSYQIRNVVIGGFNNFSSSEYVEKCPDGKIGFREKGGDFMKETMVGFEGSTAGPSSKFRKVGGNDFSSNQELSLRYLERRPDGEVGFREKGCDFMKEKMVDYEDSTAGPSSRFRKVGDSDCNNFSSSQELSLRYLEKSLDGKIGFREKGGDFVKEKMQDFEGSTAGPSSLFGKVGVSDYNNFSSSQELSLKYLEKSPDGQIGFREKGGDFLKEKMQDFEGSTTGSSFLFGKVGGSDYNNCSSQQELKPREEKIGFQEKGGDFMKEKMHDFEGSTTGPSSIFRRVGVSDDNNCSSRQELTLNNFEKTPDGKIGNGVDFPKEKMLDFEGSTTGPSSRFLKVGSSDFTNCSSQQELTFNYLCDNANKDVFGKNLLNGFEKLNGNYKGKEIMVNEDDNRDYESNESFVVRDFLQLNENTRGKREAVEEAKIEPGNREKKPKIESLNLSLALPDVSLSLAGSNRVQHGEFPARLRSTRSVQSLAPSNNTLTTYSNDFSAASLSYSYSHQFSHNPSCSLTGNSTENYEYSMGSHRRDCDKIWNCGEGTNGSVHSRFRPIGDGKVALTGHAGGSFTLGNRLANRDSCNNGLYRTTSSDNNSFFPSELPARPMLETHSGDSKGKGSEKLIGVESLDGEKSRRLSMPERLLREIVYESIPTMARLVQELPQETLESTREYLKKVIEMPERTDELASLQRKLERRSDVSTEVLSKSPKFQLEILVAIKTGLGSFLSSNNRIPEIELVEIFMLERCRNVACKRLLPVEDCDCKICSMKKGFCSECMCPVCFNFDCANNTCSWIGCDVCSHWCHAACGMQKKLIKPGPSLKGPSGTTEIQFHCLGCGHASEMFGFVKDVFISCAKEWSLDTFIRELNCVKKIFQGSEDFKGQQLFIKADEMVTKLDNRSMSPSDVCSYISQFFKIADSLSGFTASICSKDLPSSSGLRNDAVAVPPLNSLVTKSSIKNLSSSSNMQSMEPIDLHQNLKTSQESEKMVEDGWSVKPSKNDGFNSLESVVRIKEAEARMFQTRAEEARREADSYQRMLRFKINNLEEEYAEKLDKLRLQETEERRRKKLGELKILEDAHCDYYKMKMRMQSEIAGLLSRMETTKQQLM